MTRNQKAFLDMLAVSEIGRALLAMTDNGYDVLVGSTPKHPRRFLSYHDHPNSLYRPLRSSAAGRYQIIHPTWVEIKELLGLKDFSPESQDLAALKLVERRGALDEVEEGRITRAIHLCRKEWASLPEAGYGQHENKLSDLLRAYMDAGGMIAT